MPAYQPSRDDPLGLHPKCPRCWGVMKPGKAIEQTRVGSPDMGEVVTMSAGGPGRLVDCMKCDACGHSRTMEVEDYGQEEGRVQEEGGRPVSGYAESAGPVNRSINAPVDPWQHRSSGMRCRTCLWFAPKQGSVGRCRRHAPTMNGYPVVYLTDWCGDHKLDENRLADKAKGATGAIGVVGGALGGGGLS